MKKTLLMGLALIAFAHASTDGAKGSVSDKGEFGRSLDRRKPSDLNNMSAAERTEFRANLARERAGSPYKKGYGAYKGQVDQWDAAAARAEAGERLVDANPLAVPMRMRPVAQKEVVDMFRVTEEQLRANPDKARQFYTELQDTKKSVSYQTQRGTKSMADRWIDWLNMNGFGEGAAAGGGASGSRRGDNSAAAASSSEAATVAEPRHVRSSSAERRRIEADREEIERQVALAKLNNDGNRKG